MNQEQINLIRRIAERLNINIVIGKGLIRDTDKCEYYSYKEFVSKFFDESDIEIGMLVEFNKLIKMKKSDLKPGMVIEYANKEKRLVVTINAELYLISRASFMNIKSYNEDLICNSDPKLNIVKVYQPKEAASLSTLLLCNNCIWKRPKETVLTMQEIADKFGIPVEQLKIKK